jgi:hypothetical protein
MTFVIYIVDLTAADLFFFKLMPTCRCLELSCAVLSLDEKTVIAELHKTDNANPKDVWDCINASYLLGALLLLELALLGWKSLDAFPLQGLARPRWKSVVAVLLLELACPQWKGVPRFLYED